MQSNPHLVGLRGMVRGPGDGLYMVMNRTKGDLSEFGNRIGYASRSLGLPHLTPTLLSQYFLREAVKGIDAVQSSGACTTSRP